LHDKYAAGRELINIMTQGRTLVLSVDRDDDIGWKAKIESPCIGRAACLKAANTLALADPEDSDVNAIFSAVKIYDELIAKGEETAIAVVAGNHLHMIEGDRRIATSLEKVMEETKVTNCILVTDGAEDEYVIPIIQSKIPVSSIRRVIVNQMPNLEGTYYILKKLFDDPKISRMVFIPIGLAMLLYASAYLLGAPGAATIVVVGVIGCYLLYKGFGFDELVHGITDALRLSLSRGRFSFVTYTTTILLIIIGFTVGFINILKYYSTDSSLGIITYLMSFIYGAFEWLIFAGLVLSVGVIIDVYQNEKENLGKVIVFPFFVTAIGLLLYAASIYIISFQGAQDFPLSADTVSKYILWSTIGGIVSAVAGVVIQYSVNKKIAEQQKQEIIEVM
jgi:putative membrane protein